MLAVANRLDIYSAKCSRERLRSCLESSRRLLNHSRRAGLGASLVPPRASVLPTPVRAGVWSPREGIHSRWFSNQWVSDHILAVCTIDTGVKSQPPPLSGRWHVCKFAVHAISSVSYDFHTSLFRNAPAPQDTQRCCWGRPIRAQVSGRDHIHATAVSACSLKH